MCVGGVLNFVSQTTSISIEQEDDKTLMEAIKTRQIKNLTDFLRYTITIRAVRTVVV